MRDYNLKRLDNTDETNSTYGALWSFRELYGALGSFKELKGAVGSTFWAEFDASWRAGELRAKTDLLNLKVHFGSRD